MGVGRGEDEHLKFRQTSFLSSSLALSLSPLTIQGGPIRLAVHPTDFSGEIRRSISILRSGLYLHDIFVQETPGEKADFYRRRRLSELNKCR